MAVSAHADDLDQLDITTTARYVEHGFPWREWDVLRDVAPVYRYERPGVPACWVVTRYDDIKQVERQPDLFINGGPILRLDSDERLARLDDFKVRQAERWGWDPDEPLDMVYRDRPDHTDFRMLSLPDLHPRRDEPSGVRPRRARPARSSPASSTSPGRPRPTAATTATDRSTSCRRSRWAYRWRRSVGSSACRRATGPTSSAGPTAWCSRPPRPPTPTTARRHGTPAAGSASSTRSTSTG